VPLVLGSAKVGFAAVFQARPGRWPMKTYVILSRISPDAFREPGEFKRLAETVEARIKAECPEVKWKHSYATLGRFDIIDIVESDDEMKVEKAAMIIRAYGHSTTETMLATPWKEFLASL
jgi:uncharacterized protein with GYD domain